MLKSTIKRLIEKFGGTAKCRVHYQNQKQPVEAFLQNIERGPKIVKVTVLFAEPVCYYVDGDACYRDGVSYQIE